MPVVCDHLDPSQVGALVSRIESDQGRLDVLVNNIWGGDHLAGWDAKLWEHDLDAGLRTLRLAIDTHIVTSHAAIPLLIGGARRTVGDRGHRRRRRFQR